MKTRITPEKLVKMTRAGSLIDQAAKFTKADDLWAVWCRSVSPLQLGGSGESIMAGSVRLPPWPYTEDDYQDWTMHD
jgi:hypothetical protein